MITVLATITVFLFLLYGSIILYYSFSWIKIPDEQSNAGATFKTKISVLIAARNEELSILACINSVLKQTYPCELFEIIVIDDHSTDDTTKIVQAINDPRVRLILLSEQAGLGELNSYKKKAIETGIAQANGALIVTTDADCLARPGWLESMACVFEKENAAFIAAPVVLKQDLSFIGIFQTLDFMTLQGITGAAVSRKLHPMCNGANLAYPKTVFEELGGFNGIDKLASGDDMLMMQKISSKYPDRVHFIKSKEAIITTKGAATISEFINQRIRWASKTSAYNSRSLMLVLFVVYFFNLLMLLFPVTALLPGTQPMAFMGYSFTVMQLWAILLVCKVLIELLLLIPVARFFEKLPTLFWFPFMQPIHIFYTVIAGFFGRFGSYSWKGRQVR